jgi:hypothetical protein
MNCLKQKSDFGFPPFRGINDGESAESLAKDFQFHFFLGLNPDRSAVFSLLREFRMIQAD